MVKENMEFLKSLDSEIGEAVEKEFARQSRNIELIASENIVSEAVLAAAGTVLTNKYAEGYPSKRYYGGCECVDIAEELARKRACELFGADHANVQPHSGANANFAVYTAFCKPGDTVMGMNLAHGGHLTHGSPVNVSGMFFNIVPYGVNDEGFIDYDEMERIAKETKPKMIIAGASAYPRTIDFERFAHVAKEVGAIFMVDMAHIAGLVAAGLHPSPVPYADVVTSTTHKTLRGPRGGLILCKEQYAKQIDKAIFPGTQGGLSCTLSRQRQYASERLSSRNSRHMQSRLYQTPRLLRMLFLKKASSLFRAVLTITFALLTSVLSQLQEKSSKSVLTRYISQSTRTQSPTIRKLRSLQAA